MEEFIDLNRDLEQTLMISYADLTDDQKQLYLKALITVARADEQLDDDEATFFTQIAEGMGIDPATVQSYLETEVLDLEQVPGLHSAVGALILRDLAAMAVVNNELAEAEEDMIIKIGKAMQFTEEEIDEFLNWAFMGLQWQLKSTSLLEKYS